jgi:hypothetical protein
LDHCSGSPGVALVYWPELDNGTHRGSVTLGALFTVGAVLVTTLGNLVAHHNHERKLTGWATMAWSMGYGGLASLVAAIALGEPLTFDGSPAYVLSLLYLTVFGSILAFAGFLELLGRVGPARASYVGVMVPIVALLISSVFEGFTWQALTFVGVAILGGRERAGAAEVDQANASPLAAFSRRIFGTSNRGPNFFASSSARLTNLGRADVVHVLQRAAGPCREADAEDRADVRVVHLSSAQPSRGSARSRSTGGRGIRSFSSSMS